MLEEDDVQVREYLVIRVGPVRILDSQVKRLRGKEIQTVKVFLERGNSRNDVGDGRCHEEAISSPFPW